MNIRLGLLVGAGLFAIMGQGCIPEGLKKAPPIQGEAIKKVTCATIDQTRTAIHQEFSKQMEQLRDEYWEDYRTIDTNRKDCMDQLYQGSPCDDQWNALQASYANVSKDVTNDVLYNDYKSKQAEWMACHNNFEQELKNWEEREKDKGQKCQERFQSEVDQLQAERKTQEEQAKQKRDADLAALAEFEKQCKTPGGDIVGDGTAVVVGGPQDGQIPQPGPVQAGSAACGSGGGTQVRTTIPGENTAPRTGTVAENPAKDVLTEIMIQTAEGVTGTPIPTSAINDKIFAGIVCTKLYSRILELEAAAGDAEWSNNRGEQIRLRKELARYRQAQSVWCAIAQGKPPADLQTQIGQIQNITECKTDADCGPPVCCSETEIGMMICSSAGKCVPGKRACARDQICTGRPAMCLNAPQKIRVVAYQGTYLPADQIHQFTGPECDGDAHWHANRGSVKAVNGTVFIDQEDCGYGKTKDMPVIEIVILKK